MTKPAEASKTGTARKTRPKPVALAKTVAQPVVGVRREHTSEVSDSRLRMSVEVPASSRADRSQYSSVPKVPTPVARGRRPSPGPSLRRQPSREGKYPPLPLRSKKSADFERIRQIRIRMADVEAMHGDRLERRRERSESSRGGTEPPSTNYNSSDSEEEDEEYQERGKGIQKGKGKGKKL